MSVKMIDGTEKRKRQLAFELQSSRVFETRELSELLFLGSKINPGLALIGLRTTRPRT